MSSKWLRCGFPNTTFESSRFESCSHYEKEIVKHFHGKPVISWAMIAWNFKKHRFPKRFWPFFTRKWFRRDKYATCGLRVTLQYHSYHNVPIRLSVLTLTFANGPINLFELSCGLVALPSLVRTLVQLDSPVLKPSFFKFKPPIRLDYRTARLLACPYKMLKHNHLAGLTGSDYRTMRLQNC